MLNSILPFSIFPFFDIPVFDVTILDVTSCSQKYTLSELGFMTAVNDYQLQMTIIKQLKPTAIYAFSFMFF